MIEGSISFDSKINGDVFKILNEVLEEQTCFSLGIDYGNGDIQSIGTFELLPNKINHFKRKRKGKRYIISTYEISNEFSLIKLEGVKKSDN